VAAILSRPGKFFPFTHRKCFAIMGVRTGISAEGRIDDGARKRVTRRLGWRS